MQCPAGIRSSIERVLGVTDLDELFIVEPSEVDDARPELANDPRREKDHIHGPAGETPPIQEFYSLLSPLSHQCRSGEVSACPRNGEAVFAIQGTRSDEFRGIPILPVNFTESMAL